MKQPRSADGKYTNVHSVPMYVYRGRAKLCVTCAQPAEFMPHLERHSVFCARHRRHNRDAHRRRKLARDRK